MGRQRIKIAVTGAAGQIGYALLFRLASGEIFGDHVEIELQLLELESALKSLEGTVMELNDCAFPLLKKITCTSDLDTAMKDINWAVLIGSVPRRKGMERSDLLAINASIFVKQGRSINRHASSDVRVFVVGNPCNTNCLTAMNAAPDIPNDRFYAMTALDENRAKTLLAEKTHKDIRKITNMTIWGNHSSTQFPDLYNTQIEGEPVYDLLKDKNWCEDEFITTLQTRGAAIIESRGSSSAASAAHGVIRGIYSLTHDTEVGDSFSMCVVSTGEYGVDEGLIFSYPCRCIGGRLEIIKGRSFDDFGRKKFAITLEELKSERETLRRMGLI